MTSKTITTTITIAGALLLCLSIYMQYLGMDYGDKQWEMLYGRMWADGRRIYTDFVPVTPPLFFWIYGLAASLSKLPGFPNALDTMLILGLCMIAPAVFLSTRLIALHPGFAGGRIQLAYIAMLCFVLIFRTSPIYFLDREHLFLVLILPYLMRFMPSLALERVPGWLSILTGILAGIGFCIKPYCLVAWAGIQVLYIIEQKSLRILTSIENIIIYAIGLLYVCMVWQWLYERTIAKKIDMRLILQCYFQ